MRRPAEWMKMPADDRILEFMDYHDIILSPAVIAKNTDYDPHYIRQRIGELHEHGLIVRESRGYYTISEIGRKYLDGEIDADDLSDD